MAEINLNKLTKYLCGSTGRWAGQWFGDIFVVATWDEYQQETDIVSYTRQELVEWELRAQAIPDEDEEAAPYLRTRDEGRAHPPSTDFS